MHLFVFGVYCTVYTARHISHINLVPRKMFGNNFTFCTPHCSTTHSHTVTATTTTTTNYTRLQINKLCVILVVSPDWNSIFWGTISFAIRFDEIRSAPVKIDICKLMSCCSSSRVYARHTRHRAYPTYNNIGASNSRAAHFLSIRCKILFEFNVGGARLLNGAAERRRWVCEREKEIEREHAEA